MIYAVYFLRSPRAQQNSEPQHPRQTAIDTSAVADRNPKSSTVAEPQRATAASTAYAQIAYKLAMAENQELRFFARIVDQSGSPVPNAHVRVVHSRFDEDWIIRPVNESPGLILTTNDLISDANGWCALAGGKARSLRVVEISKQNYVWDNLKSSEGFHYSLRSVSLKNQELPDYMNSQRGVLLPIWKKQPNTTAIIRVDCSLNLKIPEVTEYEIPLMGEASALKLRIRMPRIYPTDVAKAADREIIFEIHQGEIQETADHYPYLAPESGYSNQWKRAFEPSKPSHFSNGWKEQYYLRARSNKLYGALQIVFSTLGSGSFVVSGYLNPTGSRNLEPDPEKLITDQEEIRRLDEQTRLK